MTVYLPKGVKDSGIIDPEEIGNEFIRASKVAKDSTQYQWANNALFDGAEPKVNLLKRGSPVKIESVEQAAFLRADTSSVPKTDYSTTNGVDPLLTVAAGDPNLFHIPYARGYSMITGATDMEISWTTEYPELVLAVFSFQFIRNASTDIVVWTKSSNFVQPVVQIRVTLNGGVIPGAGIYATPLNESTRGTGLESVALRSTILGMTLVPAGSHVIRAEAGQNPTGPNALTSLTVSGGSNWAFETPPDEGVCIAHRKLMLIRFPRGNLFGG
tara:strand:+ start:228 stop:1040 length:813 start_codon:yes stop_codon:yes gene_type:complete